MRGAGPGPGLPAAAQPHRAGQRAFPWTPRHSRAPAGGVGFCFSFTVKNLRTFDTAAEIEMALSSVIIYFF